METCPVAHGYDPLAPANVLDPYPAIAELRDAGPVFYMPELDHYVVTRFTAIENILVDRETWSAANASSPLSPVCQDAQEVLKKGYPRVPTLNNADSPRHQPMRKSVLSVLTPRRMRALEPMLRSYATELFDGFADEPEIDFIDRFAFPFPGYAAFTLLGFPEEDTKMLRDWSTERVLLTYGRISNEAQVDVANIIVAFWKYVEEHVARRAEERADDLTSDLLDVAEKKPDQLNQFDIVNMVYSMALAGHETTTNALGNGLRALLTNRDQWQAIVEDQSKIPNAIEEMLRYDGSVLNHRRISTVDTEIEGIAIPAGSKIMMCFGSAARDSENFENADTFDIMREDAELHLGFGKGPHLCLGAPLARLEMRIAFEIFSTRTPNMEMVEQDFHYSPNALFRGLSKFQVKLNADSKVSA